MIKRKRGEHQQLEGYARIWRKVGLLAAYLFLLVIIYQLMNTWTNDNPLFHIDKHYPGGSESRLRDFWGYFTLFFTGLFGICLFVTLVEFARESYIQRAMRREEDLELLRLELEVEEARNHSVVEATNTETVRFVEKANVHE